MHLNDMHLQIPLQKSCQGWEYIIYFVWYTMI